ncbi:hypothetical protein FACS1894211_11290 [Clostridia bacterium]|nr:hypothetical protein FACS1894211_11290 [Clostridia bacterium]
MIDKKKFDGIVTALEGIGIVPVIKLEDTSKALKLAKALIDGGIPCAEVTFRAKGADKVIADIVKRYPDMTVGAGTVLTAEQADSAIAAGAKFLVAPGLNPRVVERALGKGIPFIPGVSSPSEIEQALELGLKYVKFFPAEQAGGIGYIKAVAAPYGDVRFMPTGGINESNISDYLASDRVFACGGSWMVTSELVNAEKWEGITALCRSVVSKILGFELAHVGINSDSETVAVKTARLFSEAFGLENKIGVSSVFCSTGIEIMKSKYLGTNGHIAIKTNSVLRALAALKARGFEADMDTAKYDDRKRLQAVYLKKEFGGFAVHLLQKK